LSKLDSAKEEPAAFHSSGLSLMHPLVTFGTKTEGGRCMCCMDVQLGHSIKLQVCVCVCARERM